MKVKNKKNNKKSKNRADGNMMRYPTLPISPQHPAD